MKIVIGYFDKDGEYLGKKYPGPKRISYLMTGQLIKKIAEYDGVSPYKYKDIDKWNNKFCDKRRLVLNITKFSNGRIAKINENNDNIYHALNNIKRHFNKKKIYYYSKKLNVPQNDIYFEK